VDDASSTPVGRPPFASTMRSNRPGFSAAMRKPPTSVKCGELRPFDRCQFGHGLVEPVPAPRPGRNPGRPAHRAPGSCSGDAPARNSPSCGYTLPVESRPRLRWHTLRRLPATSESSERFAAGRTSSSSRAQSRSCGGSGQSARRSADNLHGCPWSGPLIVICSPLSGASVNRNFSPADGSDPTRSAPFGARRR
jgi:hypothetical protein